MFKSPDAKHLISRFGRFIIPYWYHWVIVLVCMLCGTACSLVPPYITKIIVDDILPAKQISPMLIALAVLLSVVASQLILSFVSDFLYAFAGNQIVLDIRVELFQHLINMPMSFHNRQKTGDLVFRLNNDVGIIQSVLTSSVLGFLHNFLTLIGLVIMLCWLNTTLFLSCIVVIPLFMANLTYFQPKIQRVVESIQKQSAGLSSYVIERFNHVPLIQLSNTDGHETNRFRSGLVSLIATAMRHVLYSISMGTVSSGLVAVFPIFILGLGGYQVMQGVQTLGTLVAFLQYTARLFRPVQGLHDLYIQLVRGLVSMRRVLEFMQVPTQVNTHVGHKPFVYDHAIEMRNVHFSFEGQPVLHGVNLKLIKGKTYALVGESGSGKTTLANLLCGFYHPDRGRILADGVPLQEIALMELRRHVGLVGQQVHLFHDSIWENVRYGNFEQAPEEIERLIRAVGLKDLDLHAEIGEQGVQLSGGQKQRIALARVLLRPVELLILDEATAALDPASEESIIQYARRSLHGKTLLMISHRLSVVRDVDEVIFLANGGVVDHGSPDTLLGRTGNFKQFFQHQQEGDSGAVVEKA